MYSASAQEKYTHKTPRHNFEMFCSFLFVEETQSKKNSSTKTTEEAARNKHWRCFKLMYKNVKTSSRHVG